MRFSRTMPDFTENVAAVKSGIRLFSNICAQYNKYARLLATSVQLTALDFDGTNLDVERIFL